MVKKRQKQHYVPQFYLRYFSPEEDGSYVYCYDKKKKASFRTSTSDICREINFYDSKYGEKSVEDAFAIGEKYWSTLFRKVIDTKDLSVLNIEEFAGLLGFVLLSKQRTRRRRNLVSRARMISVKEINEQLTDWKIVPTDDWQRIDHLKSIIDLQKEEGRRLFRNDWVLIINNSPIPFWTSDDPVVQQLVTTDRRLEGSYDVKNYFPITPRMLMFSEPLLSDNVKTIKIDISDEGIITNLNRLIFNNAYRFVISNDKSFLSAST